MAMAAVLQPTPEGLARLGELREEAYTKVLRAFTQETFDWKREKVLGNLRRELHIGNDAHADLMDYVLHGKEPPRPAAAASGASVRAQAQQQPALPSGRHQSMAGSQWGAGYSGPGRGGEGQFPQQAYGSPAMAEGVGARSVRRRSLDAGPMGMPPIPGGGPGGGYPAHAAQHAGDGGDGQWQRGTLSPHQMQQQQAARQHGGGHVRHPAQHSPYGSPTLMQAQQLQPGYPQLPHHHLQPSPHGGRPGDYAPTYASPYGPSQAALAQQQQQPYGTGIGAARELWPPQQGGRPLPHPHPHPHQHQQQHLHGGMPGGGGGSGGMQYKDGYGVGAPPGAHAAAYAAASPVGGGRGSKGAKGRPPTKKRPPPGGDDGDASFKPAKKKKGEAHSPLSPGVQAPVAGASALRLDALLGHRVKVFWPADGGWWDGVITDFNALTGQHCVVYEYGTPDESFEWTQIRGAHSGEVQVLDATVDLLQARPHGSGVPQQMAHTVAQPPPPPPKPSPKPGRKSKAALAAGNGGVSAPMPNGRSAAFPHAPPPKAKPQMPNGFAHSGYLAADEYREQQAAAPAAPEQHAPQHNHRPPPAQDDGYGFRVVGDNSDDESDSEQYSNESYD